MFAIVGQCLQGGVNVYDCESVCTIVGQCLRWLVSVCNGASMFAMVSQSAVIGQCLLQLLPTFTGVQYLTPPLTSSPMTSSFAYYLP